MGSSGINHRPSREDRRRLPAAGVAITTTAVPRDDRRTARNIVISGVNNGSGNGSSRKSPFRCRSNTPPPRKDENSRLREELLTEGESKKRGGSGTPPVATTLAAPEVSRSSTTTKIQNR